MARMRSQAAVGSSAPWWLLEGDEECHACGQLYIYELEFHCPDCETVSCIHCRRRHSDGRMVCVSCADSAGQGGSHGG